MFVILAHNVTVSLYIHRFIYIYIYRPIDFAIHLKNALKTLLQNIVLIILLTKIVESSNNSIDN